MSRAPTAVLVLLAVVVLAAPAEATRAAGVGALVVSGRGHGHGVGLSQWGAEERAAAGQRAQQILRFYYPGTTPGRAAPVRIRVLVAAGPRALVGSRAAFAVRDATGAVLELAAGRYAVTPDGHVGTHRLTLPAVVVPGASPVTAGASAYAGSLTLLADAQRLEIVNALELEDYLVGVVSSECPGYWRPAALQAQAIASRSYALANLRPSAPFDLYDDDRSQNYHGLRRSFPTAAAAVRATRGEILEYGGQVADAMFSAANGGLTGVPQGLWSDEVRPYFVSRPDRFDVKRNTAWGPVRVDLARLRSDFPTLPAVVVAVTIARNAGERAVRIGFEGSDGNVVSIPGYAFQQRLGLKSTYFTIATADA